MPNFKTTPQPALPASLPLLAAAEEACSVSELTGRIRAALEGDFAEVRVRGEISNLAIPSSGHWYFTLKDARAQIRAVCFRNAQRSVRMRPRDGMEVVAEGRVSVYEPRGEYQLIVESLAESGLGRLMVAFEQLKEKLRREGLFETARKKPIPLLPTRVGVVTSPSGAAVRDILQVLGRRNSSVNVLLWPTKVQGEGAADEIAEGVRHFNRTREVDVLIVGRGGGSLEDLWAFNEEVVARAVFASEIPVISAVGHEVDFTICDFVADVRAPTPSAAAEMVAAAADELRRRVKNLQQAMVAVLQRTLARNRHTFEMLVRSPAVAAFPHRVQNLAQWVDDLAGRLPLLLRRRLEANRTRLADASLHLATVNPQQRLRVGAARLAALQDRLAPAVYNLLSRKEAALACCLALAEGLSPLAVLQRGYALCFDEEGKTLRSWAGTGAGRQVGVLLGEGRLDCLVQAAEPEGWRADAAVAGGNDGRE